MFYGSGELVGQRSIVDVQENGCRITGRMPVEVGSHPSSVSGQQTTLPISSWRSESCDGHVDLNLDCFWTPACRISMNLRTTLPRSLVKVLPGSAASAYERSLQTCRRRSWNLPN